LIQFISNLNQNWKKRPFIWSDDKYTGKSKMAVPGQGRILVLAPHPDDPESVVITTRLLKESGCDIYYAIVSMSPNGVEDVYAQQQDIDSFPSLIEKKIEIRRREQIRSVKMFGLISTRLEFLNIQPNSKKN